MMLILVVPVKKSRHSTSQKWYRKSATFTMSKLELWGQGPRNVRGTGRHQTWQAYPNKGLCSPKHILHESIWGLWESHEALLIT